MTSFSVVFTTAFCMRHRSNCRFSCHNDVNYPVIDFNRIFLRCDIDGYIIQLIIGFQDNRWSVDPTVNMLRALDNVMAKRLSCCPIALKMFVQWMIFCTQNISSIPLLFITHRDKITNKQTLHNDYKRTTAKTNPS